MFKRVLVPLDGSETSEWILPLAARVSAGAEWTFLRAIDLTLAGEIELGYLTDFTQREAMDNLSRLASRYTPTLGRVATQVEFGDAAGVILRDGQPEEYDLIAMTTHGRTGIERWMLGSVAERVLRSAKVPVLVAREQIAKLHEPLNVRRIAVALDGTVNSEVTVPIAEKIARELSAEITFIHVVEPHDFPKESRLGHLVIERLGRFENRVQELERQTSERGIHTQLTVTTGHPASRILDYCRENPVDLLLMATHGRSGIKRWFLGSVTEKVLRASEVPMLVVRSEEPAEAKKQTA